MLNLISTRHNVQILSYWRCKVVWDNSTWMHRFYALTSTWWTWKEHIDDHLFWIETVLFTKFSSNTGHRSCSLTMMWFRLLLTQTFRCRACVWMSKLWIQASPMWSWDPFTLWNPSSLKGMSGNFWLAIPHRSEGCPGQMLCEWVEDVWDACSIIGERFATFLAINQSF